MKGGATAAKKPGSSGGNQKSGNSATRQQKVKAISGDTAGNPAEVRSNTNECSRLRNYLMKARSCFQGRAVTSNRIWSKLSHSSLKPVTKILVRFLDILYTTLELAAAFHYRGRCYQGMGDFQRALYDFTLAIKLDNQNQAKPQDIAEHYSKIDKPFKNLNRLRWIMSLGVRLIRRGIEAL